MGCCTSKESAPEASTPYPNAPCAPVTSHDPPPSQPRIPSYARRPSSVNSSLAPATTAGLDSSRTNIIQPPVTPSPSPLPPNIASPSTAHTTDSPDNSDPTNPKRASRRNRRSLFGRPAPASPSLPSASSSSPTTTLPRTAARAGGGAGGGGNAPPGGESFTRPNAPLRPPSPVRSSPKKAHIPDAMQPRRPWTRRVLAQQRAEFFDTQTSGREEVWAVVRFVCEAMGEVVNARKEGEEERGMREREGEGEGEGEGGDGEAEGGDGGPGPLADAQGILDAAGLTCPTGRMKDGVYDAQGNRYVVPTWAIRDPDDVVEDGEEKDEKGEEEQVTKVEKGKGRMVEDENDRVVTVRVRRSDPETNYKVRMGKAQSVGTLIEAFREEAKLPPDANIRIFFLGKQMIENKSLAAQTQGRWRDGDVVIAFVSQRCH